jgi:hypothetical protein
MKEAYANPLPLFAKLGSLIAIISPPPDELVQSARSNGPFSAVSVPSSKPLLPTAGDVQVVATFDVVVAVKVVVTTAVMTFVMVTYFVAGFVLVTCFVIVFVLTTVMYPSHGGGIALYCFGYPRLSSLIGPALELENARARSNRALVDRKAAMTIMFEVLEWRYLDFYVS